MYLTLIFFLVFLLPIPLMMQTMAKRETPFRVVVYGALAACIGAAFVMILASMSGQSVFSEMQAGIEALAKNLANNTSLAEAMGTEKQSVAQRTDFFVQYYEQAGNLLPASIGIVSVVISYLEYVLLSKLYRPKGIACIPMTPMRRLDLPRSAVTGFVLMYVAAWILTVTEVLPSDIFYNNINVLFDFVFCIQGMSVLFYFVNQKHAPRIIAVILVLFFMTVGFGHMVLFILGLLDLIFGLKRENK